MFDHNAIREAILASHKSGKPMILRDIVNQFGCSIRTAHNIRNRLIADGLLPAEEVNLKRAGRRAADTALKNHTEGWDRILQDVLEGRVVPLSEEQQKALLSATIISHPNASLRVAAQNALTRLNSQSQTISTYAPSIPLTDEARIERLAALMQSQGLVIVRAALKAAFPRSAARHLETLEDENEEENGPEPVN